jgi:hypothetical protein
MEHTIKESVMNRIAYSLALAFALVFAVIPQFAKAGYDFYYYDYYIEPVYQAVVDPPPPPPPSCADSGQVGNYPNCFPAPPPQVATVCWSGSCWNDSNEGAGGFVQYYLSSSGNSALSTAGPSSAPTARAASTTSLVSTVA